MHNELTLSEREAVHDLVNLRLYPSPHLCLGQVYRLNHAGSTVAIERTGSPWRFGISSLSYRYRIEGSGYDLSILVVYASEQQATAFVEVMSISPDLVDGGEDFLAWLRKLTAERRSPSDPFFDELLLN